MLRRMSECASELPPAYFTKPNRFIKRILQKIFQRQYKKKAKIKKIIFQTNTLPKIKAIILYKGIIFLSGMYILMLSFSFQKFEFILKICFAIFCW